VGGFVFELSETEYEDTALVQAHHKPRPKHEIIASRIDARNEYGVGATAVGHRPTQ